MAPALERGAHIPWLFWILGFLLLLGVAFQLVAEFTPLFQRALAPSPSALTPGMRLAKRTWRLLAVAFIGYQVASTWWPVATGELYLEDLNGKLGAELSSVSSHGVPLIALGYLLGLAGVSYQLIESLDGVWAQLRLARAPRLRRVAPTFGRILGVGVFAVTANSVVHFATGASALSHLLTAW